MAKPVSFITDIDKNIDKQVEEVIETVDQAENEQEFVFDIKPKEKKYPKKSLPLYIPENKLKELDRLCNKLGYNRNEMINIMIEKCLDGYKSK